MRVRSTVRSAVFLLIALSLLSTRSRALVIEEKPEPSKREAAAGSRFEQCQSNPRVAGDSADVQNRQRILSEKRLSGLDGTRSL